MGAAIFYSTIHTERCQRPMEKFASALVFAWCEHSLTQCLFDNLTYITLSEHVMQALLPLFSALH